MKTAYVSIVIFLVLLLFQGFFQAHEVVERQIREQQFLRGE